MCLTAVAIVVVGGEKQGLKEAGQWVVVVVVAEEEGGVIDCNNDGYSC